MCFTVRWRWKQTEDFGSLGGDTVKLYHWEKISLNVAAVTQTTCVKIDK